MRLGERITNAQKARISSRQLSLATTRAVRRSWLA